MKLYITKDGEPFNPELDVFFIPASRLNAAAHLFIASQKWDEIVFQDIESLDYKNLLGIPSVTNKIVVNTPAKLTENTMRILVSLFPDFAGMIRKCYMTGGFVGEVLPKCNQL